MEHLFVPEGSQPEFFEYPGETDYLGVPFLEYPQLHNRQIYLQAENDHISAPRHRDAIDQDDTPFVVTWLFCGLLQEILGEGMRMLGQTPLFRHVDFVRNIWSLSGDRQLMFFDTSSLVSLLEKWATSVKQLPSVSERLYNHLSRCLTIANNVLREPSAKVQPEAKDVLVAVADLISVAVTLTFRHEGFHALDAIPTQWPTENLVNRFMSQASSLGWCPHDVAQMPYDSGPFFPTIYYRSLVTRTQPDGLYTCCPGSKKLSLPQVSQLHTNCSQALCQPRSVEAPERRQPYCLCEAFVFDHDDWEHMLRIIKVGGIPLLRCRMNETGARLEIGVVPFRPGLEYVAISHVWSHGLGNPEANEVLRCRLEYMIKAVVECWAIKGQEFDEVLIWLDTLCCPVTPTVARNQVLETMREIYTRAHYVLLLDGELVNLGMTPRTRLEAGVRVLTSDWMKRLWTLQEGLLPPEVWIRFKDTSFSLDSLQDVDPFAVPFNQYRIAMYVQHLLRSIRGSLASKKGLTCQSWIPIEEALYSRRVTVATDEALCLSTLMRLDIGTILQVAPSDRMQSLWRAIDASDLRIPRGIVFSGGPKLGVPGFRWAPATLLSGKTSRDYKVDLEPTVLTRDGLLMRCKGMILRRTCRAPNFRTQFGELGETILARQRTDKVDYVRDQHGSWFLLWQEMPAESSAKLGVAPTLATSRPDDEQLVTDVLVSRPDQSYAVIVPPAGRRTHLAQLGAHVDEVQHISIVKPLSFGRRLGPMMEPAYQLALRLAASDEFHNMDYSRTIAAIRQGAEEASRVPETRDRYTADGFGAVQFHWGVVSIAALVLAGHGVLDGETVPETQEWCYA